MSDTTSQPVGDLDALRSPGTGVTYFDNAATSFPKAPGVADAMRRFIDSEAANPGRAGHRMAVAAERMLDRVRSRLTQLFDGEDAHRLVFAMNCTDALNMAIKGVVPTRLPDGGKPHIITTVLEHNSVSRPLQGLVETGQAELTRLVPDGDGIINPDDVRKAITPRTVLIALTHCSNVLGTVQDAEAIGRIASEHEVLFCLDAAQTAGVAPISIRKMRIDLLAFPGHKSLLGPTGTGGLYVGPRCPQPAESVAATPAGAVGNRMASYMKLRAWREGGTGGDSTTPTQPAIFPYYLEGGTPNTVGVAGLDAALDFLDLHPPAEHLAHERRLVQAFIDGIADDPRLTLYGSADARNRVGTVAFNLEGFAPSDLATILDDSFGIAVRPGLHCAPGAHRFLGSFPEGAVRVSPGPFNTDAQLEHLLDALRQVAG